MFNFCVGTCVWLLIWLDVNQFLFLSRCCTHGQKWLCSAVIGWVVQQGVWHSKSVQDLQSWCLGPHYAKRTWSECITMTRRPSTPLNVIFIRNASLSTIILLLAWLSTVLKVLGKKRIYWICPQCYDHVTYFYACVVISVICFHKYEVRVYG